MLNPSLIYIILFHLLLPLLAWVNESILLLTNTISNCSIVFVESIVGLAENSIYLFVWLWIVLYLDAFAYFSSFLLYKWNFCIIFFVNCLLTDYFFCSWLFLVVCSIVVCKMILVLGGSIHDWLLLGSAITVFRVVLSVMPNLKHFLFQLSHYLYPLPTIFMLGSFIFVIFLACMVISVLFYYHLLEGIIFQALLLVEGTVYFYLLGSQLKVKLLRMESF